MRTALLSMTLATLAFVGCTPAKPPNAEGNGTLGTLSSASLQTGSASSAPTADSAMAEPMAPEADFVAVASLPYEVHLSAHRDVLFAWSLSPRADAPGTAMGIVEGDRYLEKEDLTLPGGFMMEVSGMGGAWPQGLDLLLTSSTGRTPIAEHHVLSATGWNARSRREGSYFVGVAEVDQSVVAMEAKLTFPPKAPQIKSLRGPALVRNISPPPKECQDRMVADGTPPALLPREWVLSNGFGATRAGALISLGSNLCEAGVAAEIWDADAKTSKVVKLSSEQPHYSAAAIVTRGWGEKDAFLAFHAPYHFDGSEVKPLPKLAEQITHLAPGGEGILYALTVKGDRHSSTKETKVHRYQDGKWTEVLLSTPPVSLASDKDGVVWLSSAKRLLRTKRQAAERSSVAMPTKATAGEIVASDRSKPLRSAGPVCASNVVVLYGFTKVTPDDYDFPLTRKALKGRTEFDKTRFVVARDGGQKFLTALVPDVATGRKLVTLIEKEVTGSKPQLLCANPEVVREFALDLKTGEVAK